MSSTPQEQFDSTYISSREIVRRMAVTRPTVSNAVKRKVLPAPIVVSDTLVHLWLREAVEPILAVWATTIRR